MVVRHDTYRSFLTEDVRRRDGALELGHNLSEKDDHWRACWYERTGELTVETIDDVSGIEADDFYAGISGPVEVLDRVPSRPRLEAFLGEWPALDRWRPRTVALLRALTQS